MRMGFLRYAQLLLTEARFGPNALNEVRRREREDIVRFLREEAPFAGDKSACAALLAASNKVAGGAHYKRNYAHS